MLLFAREIEIDCKYDDHIFRSYCIFLTSTGNIVSDLLSACSTAQHMDWFFLSERAELSVGNHSCPRKPQKQLILFSKNAITVYQITTLSSAYCITLIVVPRDMLTSSQDQ